MDHVGFSEYYCTYLRFTTKRHLDVTLENRINRNLYTIQPLSTLPQQ